MSETNGVVSIRVSPPVQIKLSKNVAAIELQPTENGKTQLGVISQLPKGAELEICGDGFNARTMKVHCRGRHYFVFLQDVRTRNGDLIRRSILITAKCDARHACSQTRRFNSEAPMFLGESLRFGADFAIQRPHVARRKAPSDLVDSPAIFRDKKHGV